jgi:hypothetical protein
MKLPIKYCSYHMVIAMSVAIDVAFSDETILGILLLSELTFPTCTVVD